MKISATLAKQITEKCQIEKETYSLNGIGGSVKCIDFAGNWFYLEWFHGGKVVTQLSTIETARLIWIGQSQTGTISL